MCEVGSKSGRRSVTGRKRKAYVVPETREERAVLRRDIGPLRDADFPDSTLQRYFFATLSFCIFLDLSGLTLDHDFDTYDVFL